MASHTLVRVSLPIPARFRASFPEVALELRDVLDVRRVTYLGGIGETGAVHPWADGTRSPGRGCQQRLRVALQVALTLAQSESGRIAQAWFTLRDAITAPPIWVICLSFGGIDAGVYGRDDPPGVRHTSGAQS